MVTLYIGETSIRLMVAQGKRVKSWAESQLEPGLVENNIVTKETEVGTTIRRLFVDQKIRTNRVALGMSGVRCFTRPFSLPRLPKEMLEEAVRREAQRVLPVPLEELYLSWQIIPSAGTQTQVFMVGIPRRAADALVRTLRHAGLKIGSLEIKPLLLTRLIREATVIMVDVQLTEFDIVVMVDGVPQPIRSVRFAGGVVSTEEKLAAIKNELNRTLSFYNTNNPDKTLAPTVRALISGELAADAAQLQSLAAEIGHPVSALPLPLEATEGLELSHYAANVGLASGALPAGEKPASVVQMNTTPAVYQTKAVSLSNVLALPSAATALGLLVFLVLFGQDLSADIASINDRISETNLMLRQRQAQHEKLSDKIAELQNNFDSITSSRDSLTKVLHILETQAETTADDLKAAMDNLSQSLTLSSMRYVANVLTITGKAASEKQIASYITRLDESGQFGNVVITDMVRGADGLIDFTVVGTLQRQGIGASSIEIALGSLPTLVTLIDVNTGEGTVTLSGTAPDSDRIFAYLRALEASEQFTEITIADMTRNADGSMKFSLILKTSGTGE
jgi:type IV pilus assembly protein PilM